MKKLLLGIAVALLVCLIAEMTLQAVAREKWPFLPKLPILRG